MNIIERPVVFDSITGVHSCNLTEKIQECMGLIVRTDVGNEIKLRVSQFLCTKLYDIYTLRSEKRDIVIRELSGVIMEGTEFGIRDRISYLQFRNQTVSFQTSVNLFHQNIRDSIGQVSYFQILKYILNYDNRSFDEDIIAEFETIYLSPATTAYVKMDIADIFLMNGKTQRGNEMLDEVRRVDGMDRHVQREAEAAEYRRLHPEQLTCVTKTVYKDSQNVHTGGINNSVLKACARLIELENDEVLKNPTSYRKIQKILCDISPGKYNIIDTVMTRIEIDVAKFRNKVGYFSLHDVFSCVFSFIKDHEHSNELYLRLIEEMEAMAAYCTTGHLSRLINVIQGYTGDDEDLCVRISDSQQIKAVISHFLDTVMKKAPDDVIDAMMEFDKKPFYYFVASELSKKIPSMIKEYGDVQDYIIQAVRQYTSWYIWRIEDNILIYLDAEDPKPPQVPDWPTAS
jgi:hypothetical protein